MHRIAGSLAEAGYEVILVGRKLKKSVGLEPKNFQQERLQCFFSKGFLFYAEYNLRLFFYLLFTKADILCAIDLDTILPVYITSAIKKQQRVYDAHELFTEQKEVISRPNMHRFWLLVERFAVPKFRKGYTVNDILAKEFSKRYAVNYEIIRNLPLLTKLEEDITTQEKKIIYQGAVNEGRCFETLIPAMQKVNAELAVYGTGNFLSQAKQLAEKHGLGSKVLFYGPVLPSALSKITQSAYIGLTLFEATGMNQYYSLANRFFDHIMAGIPQLCVNYPVYASINSEYEVAYMIDDTKPDTIANALNHLLEDKQLHQRLRSNCLRAREILNWKQEQAKLLAFYKQL